MFALGDWIKMIDSTRFKELAKEITTKRWTQELHGRAVCLIYFGMLLCRPARASEPLTVSLKDILARVRTRNFPASRLKNTCSHAVAMCIADTTDKTIFTINTTIDLSGTGPER